MAVQNRMLVCSLVAIVAAITISQTAAGQIESIAKLIPNDANSVLAIHSEQIRATDWFKTKNTAEKLEQLRSELPLYIPGGAKEVVLASRLDVARMKAHWEMAAIASRENFDLTAIANMYGVTVETIGGKSCCLAGDQAIIQFQPKLLGVQAPADRQTAARWIRDVESGRTGQLTQFLTEALSGSNSDGMSHVRWAVDLQDTFSPIAIRRAMSRSDVLAKSQYDKQAVSELLGGLRGLTFSIRVKDTLFGQLTWQFTSSADPIKDFGGNLAIEAMSNAGLMLDEVNEWGSQAAGNELRLAGPLKEASVRKLFSLLGVHDSQGPVKATLESQSSSVGDALRESSAEQVVRNTKRYVSEINKMVDDVNSIRNAELSQQLMWVQNYGRRIDSMSIRSVDPEIGQLGKAIASQLLEIVAVYNSANQRAVDRQRAMVPDVQVQVYNEYYDRITTPYGRYYRYDPTYSMNYDVKSTADEYNAIASDELNQASQAAGSLVEQIKEEIAQLQAIFQSRYGGK